MWIKSQDKGLYEIQGIEPPLPFYKDEDWEYDWMIGIHSPKKGATPEMYKLYGLTAYGGKVFLGEYDTERKALEVLDNITFRVSLDMHFYQMPKKGEVK